MDKPRSLMTLIRRADMTQRDVARALGIDPSLISLYVARLRAPPPKHIAAMAAMLGVRESAVRAVVRTRPAGTRAAA